MRLPSFAALAPSAVLLLACSVNIPDGRLTCGGGVGDCPPGYSCVRGLCFAPGTDGGMTAGDVPSVPETLVAIDTSDRHSCALTDQGRVFCWGDDAMGAVGNDDIADAAPINEPALVADFPAGVTLETIAIGDNFSCALDEGAAVYCWGSNANGRLGNPRVGLGGMAARPNIVELGTAVPVALSVGAAHACVITDADLLLCWGYNFLFQLGTEGEDRAAPFAPFGAATFASVSAGTGHTCALGTTGVVTCWGGNSAGQLATSADPPGVGLLARSALPLTIDIGAPVSEVVSMGSHVCARTDAAPVCWGTNFYGQLLLARPPNDVRAATRIPLPYAPEMLAGGDTLFSGHTCALGAGGDLACWGNNGAGQLGNGGTASSDVPVTVSTLDGIDWVSASGVHTCAVAGGRGYCWGRNEEGQLGIGTETSVSSPTAIELTFP